MDKDRVTLDYLECEIIWLKTKLLHSNVYEQKTRRAEKTPEENTENSD